VVLEFVEGEALADRIARGPIPVDEALAIARQIAETLEAAHEHGIIHRDPKPANTNITPTGTVKVLDFGLAKLNGPHSQAPRDSRSLRDLVMAALTALVPFEKLTPLGTRFDTCSCSVPCPFAQAPTNDNCEGILAWHIRQGNYANVRLDGLSVMALEM
jgi:serine/threonine protein kinase